MVGARKPRPRLVPVALPGVQRVGVMVAGEPTPSPLSPRCSQSAHHLGVAGLHRLFALAVVVKHRLRIADKGDKAEGVWGIAAPESLQAKTRFQERPVLGGGTFSLGTFAFSFVARYPHPAPKFPNRGDMFLEFPIPPPNRPHMYEARRIACGAAHQATPPGIARKVFLIERPAILASSVAMDKKRGSDAETSFDARKYCNNFASRALRVICSAPPTKLTPMRPTCATGRAPAKLPNATVKDWSIACATTMMIWVVSGSKVSWKRWPDANST